MQANHISIFTINTFTRAPSVHWCKVGRPRNRPCTFSCLSFSSFQFSIPFHLIIEHVEFIYLLCWFTSIHSREKRLLTLTNWSDSQPTPFLTSKFCFCSSLRSDAKDRFVFSCSWFGWKPVVPRTTRTTKLEVQEIVFRSKHRSAHHVRPPPLCSLGAL